MRTGILKSVLAGVGVVLLWTSCSLAADTWKVGDLSGDVSIGRGNEKVAAAIGSDIAEGDMLTVGDGAWIELVSTGTCQVWELKGARQYAFTGRRIVSSPERDEVPPNQRLSVCFDPSGFSSGKAQRIGGIIERGESPEDELAEIGSTSNAALINLIILYSVRDKDIEKARPYFDALKRRAPGSEFVAGVAGIFEGKGAEGK